MPSSLGTALAFTIYGLEKHITGVLHPRWTRKLGFNQVVANSREARAVGELVDAILASTCVPPVLAGDGFRGQRVLDGGIIDNVPAHLADGREGKTLVLLSKRYRQELPLPGQRVYVQPSERITLDKFDYANPEGRKPTIWGGVTALPSQRPTLDVGPLPQMVGSAPGSTSYRVAVDPQQGLKALRECPNMIRAPVGR